MQQDYARHSLKSVFTAAALGTMLSFLGGAGCVERPTTIDPAPPQPFAGVTLKIAVSNDNDREFISHLSRDWAGRSGAKVQVLNSAWDGTADVGLLSPAEMPRWAEAGLLAEIPGELRSSTNPYRWDDINGIYSIRLVNWGSGSYALPIIGEGAVLVYRKDAVAEDSVPASWDDLLAMASKFGPKSLPPLPSDPEQLSAEFFAAAACYDRLAIGRIGVRPSEDFFDFQFEVKSGQPRLGKPSFRYAAELFRKMMPFRSSANTAADSFRSGEAKIGVISLKELGRIPQSVKDQLGVAPLPGTRLTFDANGQSRPTDQSTINRVPYLGSGGRIGVVSSKCSSPEAAWNLLAELGMPERTSLDLIASPQWGAGPYRTSQLDNRARPRWFAYGLTANETDRLVGSLRDNLGLSVQNYRVRLRTPNEHEFAAAFDEEFRAVLKSDQPADLTKLNQRWRQIAEKQPAAEWKRALGKSIGVDG